MRILLAGAAAVALTASGAYAQPNKDNGNGRGNATGHENHQPAASQPGKGGGDRAQQRGNGQTQSESRGNSTRGNADAPAARNNSANSDQRGDQGNARNNGASQQAREQAQDRGNSARNSRNEQTNARPANGNGNDRNATSGNNGRGGENRGNGNGNGNRAGNDRGNDNTRQASATAPRTFRYDNSFYSRDHARSIVNGCPPGLAKKRNGCTPPGQMNERSPVFGYTYRPSLFGLSHYGSGRYYYDDGYLFRLGNNGGIAGYIPLLGGALAIGNAWPNSYTSYDLPDYYVDYYNLGDPRSYRYADNVVYRVDPETAAITSIAALLTGDNFTVGQPMPLGYDVYNVPYAYRDRYYDTPDAHYRYADGYVYQVDPETQLIAAAINLLV